MNLLMNPRNACCSSAGSTMLGVDLQSTTTRVIRSAMKHCIIQNSATCLQSSTHCRLLFQSSPLMRPFLPPAHMCQHGGQGKPPRLVLHSAHIHVCFRCNALVYCAMMTHPHTATPSSVGTRGRKIIAVSHCKVNAEKGEVGIHPLMVFSCNRLQVRSRNTEIQAVFTFTGI